MNFRIFAKCIAKVDNMSYNGYIKKTEVLT